MSELKPCPFCKTFAGFSDMPPYEDHTGYVRCNFCGAKTPFDTWNNRPIEDALHARIAECESALISMVQQFFYSKVCENIFRHAFMSAEEEAATYLVEHGIARWADKRKSSIYFNEVQE